MSNSKGDRWERNYVNALAATDSVDDREDYERVGVDDFAFVEHFTALRLPASGAGRVADLPDVHVWLRAGPDEVEQYAVEVKAGSDRVYLSNDEVDALVRYARATGATPLVFVHIDKESRHDRLGGDYVVPIDVLHSTDKGYTFTKARDGGDGGACTGVTFAEWVERPVTVF
jgi:Holliday junction resolvase